MNDGATARYRAAELAFWRANGAEPAERWVDVPNAGCRVRVLEVGEGTPVLFVHGATAGASAWAPLVARLTGHRCLVLDRPGCGLSEPSRADPTSGAALVTRVQLAVLDSFGIERLDLVGSSYGGASVLWLALAHPERVARIVLEGAPAIAGIHPTRDFRTLASPLGTMVVRTEWTRRDLETAFAGLGHRRLVDAGWFTGPNLDWALSFYNDTDTLRNDRVMLRAILGLRGFRADRLVDPARLARIDRPALWLLGTDDPLATVAQGRRWAATMPGATFEVRDGEGHVPWLDDPDGHARRIERFLARSPSAGSGAADEAGQGDHPATVDASPEKALVGAR